MFFCHMQAISTINTNMTALKMLTETIPRISFGSGWNNVASLPASAIGNPEMVHPLWPPICENAYRERPESLSGLPCVRCISISASPLWHFNERGKRLDVHVNSTFMCNQVKTTVDACVKGLGYGVFFNYQVMPWVRSGELEVVLNDFEPEPLPLSLVYPHTRLMAMRVRALIDWLAHDMKHVLDGLG